VFNHTSSPSSNATEKVDDNANVSCLSIFSHFNEFLFTDIMNYINIVVDLCVFE